MALKPCYCFKAAFHDFLLLSPPSFAHRVGCVPLLWGPVTKSFPIV